MVDRRSSIGFNDKPLFWRGDMFERYPSLGCNVRELNPNRWLIHIMDGQAQQQNQQPREPHFWPAQLHPSQSGYRKSLLPTTGRVSGLLLLVEGVGHAELEQLLRSRQFDFDYSHRNTRN